MSIADLIREKQLEFMTGQTSRLNEYHFTLRRYSEAIPKILLNAGLTHEETSVITSAFKGENFSLCQHLLLNAYESRKYSENKYVSRLFSLAMDIGIIINYKKTLNRK